MFLPILVGIFFSATPCSGVQKHQTPGPRDVLIVSGTITNAQGKGVDEALIDFFMGGKKVESEEEHSSENKGAYKA